MLYPRYQRNAYIQGADNQLWRIEQRVIDGGGQTEFKLYVEHATSFVEMDGERRYATTWLTYKELRAGRYRLIREAPEVPRLPAVV